MDDTDGAVLVLLAGCILFGIVASLIAEPRRALRQPGTRPYTWGLFQGYSAMAMGGFFGAAGLVLLVSGDIGNSVVSLLLGAAVFVPALYVVRRRRWAWIVLTIMCFNPLGWIIGYIYGANRWNELGAVDNAVSPEPAVPTARARLDRLRASGALSAEEYAQLIYEEGAQQ